MCLYRLKHQIVGDNGVAGRKECDEAFDEVPVRGAHAALQMTQIDLKIDFLDAPGVLDRAAIHLIELRIAHRPQGQIESGVEQPAHWQASQASGFSSEQATAAVSRTVVLAMLVAGRDLR